MSLINNNSWDILNEDLQLMILDIKYKNDFKKVLDDIMLNYDSDDSEDCNAYGFYDEPYNDPNYNPDWDTWSSDSDSD